MCPKSWQFEKQSMGHFPKCGFILGKLVKLCRLIYTKEKF